VGLAVTDGRVSAVDRHGAGHVLVSILSHAAVVDERLNRNELGQLGNAANVVRVKVGDEQIVDARRPSLLRDREDALRIARLGRITRPRGETSSAGKPGVDQHRVTIGRDDERGLATLDVDKVNVERLPHLDRLGFRRGRIERQGEGQCDDKRFHDRKCTAKRGG